MRTLCVRILTIGFLILLVACSKKNAAEATTVDKQAFDKAPAELKQIWDRALEGVRTNDYVVAQTLLYRLSRMELPPEQKEAVDKENRALSQRLMAAAEKGDQAALSALRELRRNPPNRQ